MQTTTRDDTFEAFVSVLTEALDDHTLSGDDLAARVHLSRFHLDRVIAAIAGEPPATLRRRVLLERAAYRLDTTDRSVLDVAVEAGYASHEAFTRAFARAYGVAPKEWRRHPTPVRLPAPNDVHFHPPGWLQLPARSKEGDMELVMTMFDHHVWAVGKMIDLAGGLNDGQLDTPIVLSVEGVDDDPTIRSLLSRLVGQMAMWNASMESRPYDWDIERNEQLTSMRERLDHEGARFKQRAAELVEDGRLDETFVNATCDPPETFSFGGVLAHVLTFAAHRRTLVTGALISAGVDVDLVTADPRAWLSDN
jgi:AraC family transcriptional regulator